MSAWDELRRELTESIAHHERCSGYSAHDRLLLASRALLAVVDEVWARRVVDIVPGGFLYRKEEREHLRAAIRATDAALAALSKPEKP